MVQFFVSCFFTSWQLIQTLRRTNPVSADEFCTHARAFAHSQLVIDDKKGFATADSRSRSFASTECLPKKKISLFHGAFVAQGRLGTKFARGSLHREIESRTEIAKSRSANSSTFTFQHMELIADFQSVASIAPTFVLVVSSRN